MDEYRKKLVSISNYVNDERNYEEVFLNARKKLFNIICKRINDGLEVEAYKGNFSASVYSYSKGQKLGKIAIAKFFSPKNKRDKDILMSNKLPLMHVELQNMFSGFKVIYKYDRQSERNTIKIDWSDNNNKPIDLIKVLNDN